MPILGLGTWDARGAVAIDAILTALEIGYRHIDTARAYENEEQVGQAIARSDLSREEIFVTTKLWPSSAGREQETLEDSLRELRSDYVDLWLIHWPPNGQARPDVWEHFVEAKAKGLARAIGVSNYSTAQLDELTRTTGYAPEVNQIPWSPVLFDEELHEAHRRRGIQLEGYSPLKTVDLESPLLVRIASDHGVTPAQVVLRWHVEHEIVAIPKSTNPGRIRENAAIFDFSLTAAELEQLNRM